MEQIERTYHVLREVGWHWIDRPPLRVQHVCVGGTDVPIYEAVSTVNGWQCPSCGLECKTWDLPGYDAQIVQTDKLILEGHPVRFTSNTLGLVEMKDNHPLYYDVGWLAVCWLEKFVLVDHYSTAVNIASGPLVRVTVEIVEKESKDV